MKLLSLVALVALPAFAAAVAVPLELQERQCKVAGRNLPPPLCIVSH